MDQSTVAAPPGMKARTAKCGHVYFVVLGSRGYARKHCEDCAPQRKLPPRMHSMCSNGCQLPVRAKGLCDNCYQAVCRERHKSGAPPVNDTCAHCGESLHGRGLDLRAKYCSPECKQEAQRLNGNAWMAAKRRQAGPVRSRLFGSTTCLACGSPLSQVYKTATRAFCDGRCKTAYRDNPGRMIAPRSPQPDNCGWCGDLLEKRPTPGKPRRYCGRSCMQKAWNSRNPETVRAISKDHQARRKARMRGSDSTGITPAEWCDLKQRFNNCCVYCGAARSLSMDHVVPLARGGAHAVGNLLPACHRCNKRKSDIMLAKWLIRRDRAEPGWRDGMLLSPVELEHYKSLQARPPIEPCKRGRHPILREVA